MSDRFEPGITIARLTDEVARLKAEHQATWTDAVGVTVELEIASRRITTLEAANAKLSEELALECASGDWMRKRLAEQREVEEAGDPDQPATPNEEIAP